MSTSELLEKIQALPAPLQHKVEDFVEALADQAGAKPEDPFFARVDALRDQIRTEYGTFPGALSHLRELRDGTRWRARLVCLGDATRQKRLRVVA
jgi:hypothetical protein